MAIADLRVFLQERLTAFDSTLDVSAGSPIDMKVIQPLLRRMGTDPFTVDLGTFIQTRLQQEFPDLAAREGDAVTDLLVKAALLLWSPIVLENNRVKRSQSFADPATLTLEEAAALGANLFATPDSGDKAGLRVRLYYAQPQAVSVSPVNFLTSRTGLHFFPTTTQSISVNEMLFNTEGSLYYFDVDTVAEFAGDQYNIGVDEIISIANLPSTVRVTNKLRARNGRPADDAVSFISKTDQSLSERSFTTARGLTASINEAFPEVGRVGVVGAGDPEMQRDVVSGGSLGPVVASGLTGADLASALPDGDNRALTRRLYLGASVNLFSLIGPVGDYTDWVLTLLGATSNAAPVDVAIQRVRSTNIVDLAEQIVLPAATGVTWMLRRREITISGIPGGILFPSGVNGTTAVPVSAVHLGGATDVCVKGRALDEAALTLDAVHDGAPLLSGMRLSVGGGGVVTLKDYVHGVNYLVDDDTYRLLYEAARYHYTLEIIDDSGLTHNAGSYTVVAVVSPGDGISGANPQLRITPTPPLPLEPFRWRLFHYISLDLVEPKVPLVDGNDLFSIQGVDFVESAGGTDFQAYGVSANDILRVANGPDAGDFSVKSVLGNFHTRVQVDRPFKFSRGNLTYTLFRPNSGRGIQRPFVRLKSVELLDTNGLSVGVSVPYAKAVDVRSRSFANTGHGVRVDTHKTRLGLTSVEFPEAGLALDGTTLTIAFGDEAPIDVAFAQAALWSPAQAVARINQVLVGLGKAALACAVGATRIGIIPVGRTTLGGTAAPAAFAESLSSRIAVSEDPSIEWEAFELDVVQVLTGTQIGVYPAAPHDPTYYVGTVSYDFYPEANVRVQLGSRSVGSARVFFLEPTSVTFDERTSFATTLDDGTVLRFIPDPSLSAQLVPTKPNGTAPKDGVVALGTPSLTSASTDFIKKCVREGDLVELRYKPITGANVLPDSVPNVATCTLVVALDGGYNKSILLLNDSSSIPTTHVTRAGVVKQINQVVGRTICSLTDTNQIEFEADIEIILRADETSAAIKTAFGLMGVGDQTNVSAAAGMYTVTAVAQHVLGLSSNTPQNETRVSFHILRSGTQRFGSTEMSLNTVDPGLYYVDVELLSEGTGDLWNIAAELPMTVEGYDSDGWWLSTDEKLSFSVLEPARLNLSASIIEIGGEDSQENALMLSGQPLQVNYERSALVEQVQGLLSSELDRVVTESVLARHLVPHFVRTSVYYSGGSRASDITTDIEDVILGLYPDDLLAVSDVERILLNHGASTITNPIELVAVVHNRDRSISLDRSRNGIGTTRLSAFIPDGIVLQRKS